MLKIGVSVTVSVGMDASDQTCKCKTLKEWKPRSLLVCPAMLKTTLFCIFVNNITALRQSNHALHSIRPHRNCVTPLWWAFRQLDVKPFWQKINTIHVTTTFKVKIQNRPVRQFSFFHPTVHHTVWFQGSADGHCSYHPGYPRTLNATNNHQY